MKHRASIALLRRLASAALLLAFLQIVFGAIVRITGSGMGCGDSWPTCNGMLFPPLERPDLIIEVTHRYIAALLGVMILALTGYSLARRAEPGIGGRGGVLRASVAALGVYIAVALLGALTVKLGTHPIANVVHLSLAMALLATLVLAVMRGGGLGAGRAAFGGSSVKTYRGASAAVALTFLILVMGALTANVPGAAESCLGFPLCRIQQIGSTHIQLTHRILAFLLLFHATGLVIATRRRREPEVIGTAAAATLAVIVAQIVIAAALVESGLPLRLQSLHQAFGTLVWLTVFTFAALAHRASLHAAAPTAGGAIPPGDFGGAPDSYLTTDEPIAAPAPERNAPARPAPQR